MHPPAVAAPSIPPAPALEEAGGGRRWLTSIAWASAAGLLIAASGWFLTHASNSDAEAPSKTNSADRVQRAQAVEQTRRSPEPKPKSDVVQPPIAEQPPIASTSTNETAPRAGVNPTSASANTNAGPDRNLNEPVGRPPTAGLGTPERHAVGRPGRGGAAHITLERQDAKTVAEVREVLAAEARANQPSAPSPSPDPAQPAPVDPGLEPNAPAGAAPESAVPAKPQAAATGMLNLAAAPWANVSLNGRSLGVTPLLNVRLPVGVHQLSLTSPELGRSTTVVVEISADKPVSRFVGWNKTP